MNQKPSVKLLEVIRLQVIQFFYLAPAALVSYF